jgi:protein-S-isoprenylcysteine O-methyltransferase Ste14
MFFLAGLGILRTLWLPFWPDVMHLGNIVYLPYIIIVYPFALIGVRTGMFLSLLVVGLGFLLFLSSIQTWLRAKLQGKRIVDSGVYRFSRHPQYLGWIVWSYGMMLFASNVLPVMGGENPGAGLPWVITTLIIVCVALGEEITMKRTLGEEYGSYRRRTPFMFPVPKLVSALITAPLRLLIKKDHPENRKELLVTFVVYLAIIILLSLPFRLSGIARYRIWYMWP